MSDPGSSMLQVTKNLRIPFSEVELTAVRSSGPGGQNVNAVATAVQLRFDVRNSSLPLPVKERLLRMRDKRMTKDGILVLKAQTARTQEANRQEALRRLQELVQQAARPPKKRRPTRMPRAAKERRLAQKKYRQKVKALRGRVNRNQHKDEQY